jgi:serine/threonine protein kinase
MELCEDGDIAHRQFSEAEAWQLLNNVAVGLAEIHAAGWIHLDVSPGNILRGIELFKLADFGTLIQIGKFRSGDEGAGPYVSPEALAFPHGRYEVGTPTDIFSLGVTMLEVLTGRKAPRGGSPGYGELRIGNIRLGQQGYESDVSLDLKQVVNQMLAIDPGARPTADRLVEITCA